MVPAFWLCLIGIAGIPASNGLNISEPPPSHWEKMTGIASQISTKHSELWRIGNLPWKMIWRWAGSGWQLIPDQADSLSAAKDGWAWKVLDWKVSRWNPYKKTWQMLPGWLEYINAYSKDAAIGVTGGVIYLWQGNNWQLLPGEDARFAAIGDEDERWYVANDDKMYRWNHKRDRWDHIPGDAYHIDVEDPDRVVYTSSNGSIYTWNSAKNHWDLDDEILSKTTSISEMGLIAMTKEGEIHRRKYL